MRGAVADIVEMVRSGGDDAIRRLTSRLDGIDLDDLRVSRKAITAALDAVPPDVRDAISTLAANLRRTSEASMPTPTRQVLPQGQIVSTRPMPVDRVGIYVPGGLAAYPSSAVMAIVPAQVAGVGGIAVCSPPAQHGVPDSIVLAACALLDVDEIYAIGGAQAVAALALGTETIQAVDVMVGPGNAYVEEAKRGLFGEVGIESLAGPSELVVLVDDTAPPEPIAWDLLAQAEHGSGALSVVVAVDELGARCDRRARRGRRRPHHRPAGGRLGHGVCVRQRVRARSTFSSPSPIRSAALGRVRHAGAIFLGAQSGTAFGDYIAGSNHILPTGGRGRFSSGLAPGIFLRIQEIVEIPDGAVEELAGPLAALARAEGLIAHARSAEVRAESITHPTRGAAT